MSENNYQYIYGRNNIIEALRNGRQIISIFLQENEKNTDGKTKGTNSDIPNIIKSKDKNIELKYLSKDKINEICQKEFGSIPNHQGVLAKTFEYHYANVSDLITDENDSLIIALDGLEDPHNLGAIVRTAEISKASGIILPKNRSVQVNATVSKVSTGAIEYVKIAQVTNLRQTLKDLKDKGYWIVGAEYTKESIDFWNVDFNMKICLVVGSEGKGISRIVLEECDYVVKIPMWGKINSLNASVSCALIIYEIRRQQNLKK